MRLRIQTLRAQKLPPPQRGDQRSNSTRKSLNGSYPDAHLSREHQANERTFLAWTRTGVGMIGFGVLIARLRFEEAAGTPLSRPLHPVDLGLLLASAGVLTVVFSMWRYYVVRQMLRQSRYESWVYGPLLFGSGVVLIGVVIVLSLLGRLPFGT